MSPKWLDNLLSHFELPGVYRSRQGVERRIDDDGLLAIEITRLLTSDLGVPVARAVMVAREVLDSGASDDPLTVTPGGIVLRFPIRELEVRLRARLVDALEAVARVPRGRPRSE